MGDVEEKEVDDDTKASPKISLARIKYLEGSQRNTCETIAVNRLNRKFESYNFNPHLKYLVDKVDKVRLLHLAETQEEMDEKLKSKTRQPPVRDLHTCTDTETDSPDLNKSFVKGLPKSPKNKNDPSSEENKAEYYENLLNSKKEKLRRASARDKQDENQEQISDDDKTDSECNNQTMKENRKRSGSPSPKSEIASPKKKKSTAVSPAKLSLSKTFAKRTLNGKGSGSSAPPPKPVIKKIFDAEDETTKKHLTEIFALTKEVKKYKDLYETFKKEKVKYERKYHSLKKDNEALLADVEQLRKLNYDLQTKVIEIAEESKIIENQLKEAQSKPIANPHNLPVGHRKSDGQIHLGNRVYMAASVLDNVVCHSSTPAQFVGNLIVAQFSEPVLINSTRTGRPSNKTLGKLKKQEDLLSDVEEEANPIENDEACEAEMVKTNSKKANNPNKLDSSQLEGCKLYYGHWLATTYFDSLSQKEQKKFDRSVELNLFNSYVTTKISNLKKSKEASKKKAVKRKQSKNSQFKSDSDDEEVKEQLLKKSEKKNASDSISRAESLLFIPTNEKTSDTDDDFDESTMYSDDESEIDPLKLQGESQYVVDVEKKPENSDDE